MKTYQEYVNERARLFNLGNPHGEEQSYTDLINKAAKGDAAMPDNEKSTEEMKRELAEKLEAAAGGSGDQNNLQGAQGFLGGISGWGPLASILIDTFEQIVAQQIARLRKELQDRQ